MSLFDDLCKDQAANTKALYVVSTPIGNLGDLTFRAIKILQTCDCIACETQSNCKKLINALNIHNKKIFIYRNDGEIESAKHLVAYLEKNKSVSLISDAGTPTISDPGYRLIKLCREKSIPIIPIPGPNAAITAISISGLPTNLFCFLGFLPTKKLQKEKILNKYIDFNGTIIMYESPYRITKLIQTLGYVFGENANCFIAKELTKLKECTYSGTIKEFKNINFVSKGEYVVLLYKNQRKSNSDKSYCA